MACASNENVPKSGIQLMINLVRNNTDLNDNETYFAPGIIPAIIEDKVIGNNIPDIRLSFWSTSLKSLILTNAPRNEEMEKALKDTLSVDFYNQKEEFLALYNNEYSLKPHGIKVYTFKHIVHDKTCHFEIYYSEFDDQFKEYHRRMESFALLYIDGAVRIQLDQSWCCFTLYEVQKTPKLRYHFVGYTTIYRFFCFPDKIRPRISQFVIIPPYQRCGIGKQLLRIVLDHLIENENVHEITVEEPCEAFRKMRDIVDAERILTAQPSIVPNILNRPYNETLITALCQRLCIPKNRVRRIYEIVVLYYLYFTNNPNEQERFRSEIEKRLTSERSLSTQQLTKRQLRCLQNLPKKLSSQESHLIDDEIKVLLKEYDSIVMNLIKTNCLKRIVES